MTDTGWIGLALVLGFAIGALVVWMINRKAAGPSHSVKALREESERFREQVNDHFVETAELINQLTDSYKKVFDHLSDGAERLVDEKVIRERMPEVSDQEIRLKRIGQISSRSGTSDQKKEAETTAPKSQVAGGSTPPGTTGTGSTGDESVTDGSSPASALDDPPRAGTTSGQPEKDPENGPEEKPESSAASESPPSADDKDKKDPAARQPAKTGESSDQALSSADRPRAEADSKEKGSEASPGESDNKS